MRPCPTPAPRRHPTPAHLRAACAVLFALISTLLSLAPAQASPAPYGGTPVTVSATATTRVEAEDYDRGGEGVAYHDLGNGGCTARRGDNVGVYEDSNASGGYGVGWANAGEWYGYTLTVAQAGPYALTARLGSDHGGGRFHLEFGPVGQAGGAGAVSSAEFTVPYASGWQTYQDVLVPAVTLPAGTLWMRVVVDDSNPCNFDFFRLTPAASLPRPTALTFSPSAVANGGSAGGSVTLGAPAPAAGMALSLASDSPAVQVPPSVTFYPYATVGYFTATSSPVTAPVTAHVTASGGGGGATGALSLSPTVSLSYAYVDEDEFDGGGGLYLYFGLNGPAPAGGVTVALASDCAAAQVPATATVPAGGTFGSAPIAVSAVTAPVTAHLTASAGGTTLEADLPLGPPAPLGLSYLRAYPNTVRGGDPTTGYVYLNGAAPAGGLAVGLTSDGSPATVPAGVTVPEGYSYATFPVATSAVPASATLHIHATGPGGPLSAPLTLTPASAPSGLTATATPTGPTTVQVVLNWTAGSGAGGYAVERSHDGSTWAQIGTTPATNYQDAAAAGGTYYYYRVRAAGGDTYTNVAYAGTGFPCLVATDLAWLPDPVFPDDHVRFFAVIQNIGTATAYGYSWTVEFEGDTYAGYNIELNPLAPGDTLLVTEQFDMWWTATPGVHHPSVVIDDSYVSLTRTLTVACAMPLGLSATAVSPTEIDLSWRPSPQATGYNLYRGTASGAETLYRTGLTGTSFADTGLTPGQTYYYQVTAVAADTEGARCPEAAAGGQVAALAVGDGGFEQPVVGAGAYQVAPTGSPWAFGGGGTGISGNGSAFTAANPDAPEGVQVGFLQGSGAIGQPLTSAAAGDWTVTFSAAQRGAYNAGGQAIRVLLDGAAVGTVTPDRASYADYQVGPLGLPAGTHTLSFEAINPSGGDNTALLDDVRVRVDGGPPSQPDFSLSVSPSLSVPQGGSGAATVTVSPSADFTGTVAFATSGLPSGVTAAFSPGSVGRAGTSALTLTAVSQAAGSYTITVTGTAPGLPAHSRTLALRVFARPSGPVSPSQGVALTDIYLPKTLRVEWAPQPYQYNTYSVVRSGGGTGELKVTTDLFWVNSFDFAYGTAYTYHVVDDWSADRYYDSSIPGYVYPHGTVEVGTAVATPMRSAATVDQAVDARYDPRFSAWTFADHAFGTNTYRGGLYAGYNGDASQVGHSLLGFVLPPSGLPAWPVGSVNAWNTRMYAAGTMAVGCQGVPTGWDPAALVWTQAPAFSPANAGAAQRSVVSYDSVAGAAPSWSHWDMRGDIAGLLGAGGGPYAAGLGGVAEPPVGGSGPSGQSASGWAYFAKAEADGAHAPCVLYALRTPPGGTSGLARPARPSPADRKNAHAGVTAGKIGTGR